MQSRAILSKGCTGIYFFGGFRSKYFTKKTKIKSNINKKGIGQTIVIRFSPCSLRISDAGMDIINGINSLMMPTRMKRILLNFPMNNRIISSRKKNLKKEYSMRSIRKYLIEYIAGSSGTSQIIAMRVSGPGPRSI